MVEEEVRAIFKTQREQGQTFAAAELEEQYLEILLSQRSFDEGPGQGSPYGGSQIEKMIGKCTLEAREPRSKGQLFLRVFYAASECQPPAADVRRRKQPAFRCAEGDAYRAGA